MNQRKGEGRDRPEQNERVKDAQRKTAHAGMMALGRSTSTRAIRCVASWTLALGACGAPIRSPGTAVLASGTDLESGNPLVTVHPMSRQLQRHALFVTLVKLDSLLQPIPYYARRWTWDATHTSVTFALSGELRWHDGVPTTARDVRFTLDAARDPALGSPRAGDLQVVDRVDVLADTLLRITFRQPMLTIPTIFAELPIVPEHLLDSVPRARWRAAAFSTAPVGNGPFRFVDRVAGRRWRFQRNTSFPLAMGGPPTLEQLVIAVVDEASTKFAGLVSGELDMAGVSPTMASLVADDPTLALMTPPALFSTVLAFNTSRAPFDDARVRRAVSMSIDRARIVQAAVAGYATPAGGAVPPGLPFPSRPAAATDTLAADQLLDAAGWRRGTNRFRVRDGRLLTVTILTVGSGDMAVEQLVQSDLRARGVDVNIRVAELATFMSVLRATNKLYDVAITGIPGDIGLGQLSALFATAQRGGALDYTGFHSTVLDSALARARRAAPVDANGAWRTVEALLADSVPMAWLYHARGVQGRTRRLENVQMDLRGELVSVAQWTRREQP